MYIVVGLGNPGKQYENTRHNIGFITVNQIAERHSIAVTKIKHKALVGEGRISGQKVLLVKPQTFMNLSGNAVREVMEYYKAETANLLVIYDDIDIAVGTLRIRKKGSAGTHNGMRSIIYDLQQDDFPRIRIGIGQDRRIPLDKYVLSGFTKEERPLLEDTVNQAVKAVECFLRDGIERAMGEYNVKPRKEGERKEHE